MGDSDFAPQSYHRTEKMRGAGNMSKSMLGGGKNFEKQIHVGGEG